MSTPPRGEPSHIAFIRNVLTHLDLGTKRAISRRVANTMAPDGCLLLGVTETTMGMDPVWERITLTKGVVYRLEGGAG